MTKTAEVFIRDIASQWRESDRLAVRLVGVDEREADQIKALAAEHRENRYEAECEIVAYARGLKSS